MTTLEHQYMYLGITEETPVCCNCKHFLQHYNRWGEAIGYGHCVCSSRMKARKPNDACDKFENGQYCVWEGWKVLRGEK